MQSVTLPQSLSQNSQHLPLVTSGRRIPTVLISLHLNVRDLLQPSSWESFVASFVFSNRPMYGVLQSDGGTGGPRRGARRADSRVRDVRAAEPSADRRGSEHVKGGLVRNRLGLRRPETGPFLGVPRTSRDVPAQEGRWKRWGN